MKFLGYVDLSVLTSLGYLVIYWLPYLGRGGGAAGKGGAHIRDLICVTELARLPVLLLCLVEAALRTGSLHQRWGQVDGGV